MSNNSPTSTSTPCSIPKTIDYIEIPTKDIALSRTFFTKLFGWNFTDYGPEYTAFEDGRLNGGFFTSDTIAHTDTGSALVVLYSENLESTFAEATRLGAIITKEIFSFPGGRRFQFTEPGGSELSVWSDKE
ncbi:MAG: VOC family protein [Akkermansiaceae bacterium]